MTADSTTPGKPVELTNDNFQSFISESDNIVVVDFWASWCGPCRRMAPEFEAAAAEVYPDIVLAKLDTDAAGESAAPFNIAGIPCLIAFQNGQEINRNAGFMPKDDIVAWVKGLG